MTYHIAIDTTDDINAKLAVIAETSSFNDKEIQAAAETIIDQVSQQGDKALRTLTSKFDKHDLTANIALTPADIKAAYAAISHEEKDALELAAKRIVSYHENIMPSDLRYEDNTGTKLGNLWRAIDRVGLYVPGGLASYPSSVLMNAIPAKVAGAKELIMTVPTPAGEINPLILVAADIAGVDKIFPIGGAQAIAALAYGTESIPAVDKIVGPGNAYVAAAKRLVYGKVGIDMIAGPSEILVVADEGANPKWVATDLLSQAEHDAHARAWLVTSSVELATAITKEVEILLPQLAKADIAQKSWETHGAIITVKQEEDITNVINFLAPEHLELAVKDPEALLPNIHHAGAIFAGYHTPEAIGDYIAGPSHVLPTSGSARFSSGLSVYDFLKRVSFIGCSTDAFKTLAPATALLAEKEGLEAHQRSITVRQDS